MIEIKAQLLRSPVYFASELVASLITFTNKDTGENNMEQLALCVVQVHCHLNADENKVSIPNRSSGLFLGQKFSNANRDTAFDPRKGEPGYVVFSTKPKILFCDLKLQPKESKSFRFDEIIPNNSPPSYNGSSIKYFYKITIGTQRVDSEMQLLRMPLKILSISELYDIQSSDLNNIKVNLKNHSESDSNSLNESVNSCFGKMTNGEKEDDILFENSSNLCLNELVSEKNDSVLDLLLHKLDCISSKRTLSSYIITNQFGKVAKFCILKSTYKLGEDVIGLFDFSEADNPCVQFTMTLQSEEKISDEFKKKSKYNTSISSYNKCQEFCLHTSNTQIILPIPLTITPTFQTNIVNLTWKLHFEFVTAKSEDIENVQTFDPQGVMYQNPDKLKVQTMIWDLPIKILPNHPIQVGRGLQMPAASVIVI